MRFSASFSLKAVITVCSNPYNEIRTCLLFSLDRSLILRSSPYHKFYTYRVFSRSFLRLSPTHSFMVRTSHFFPPNLLAFAPSPTYLSSALHLPFLLSNPSQSHTPRSFLMLRSKIFHSHPLTISPSQRPPLVSFSRHKLRYFRTISVRASFSLATGETPIVCLDLDSTSNPVTEPRCGF